MFAAEPAVGRTSSVIAASGATNLARSTPMAKYVPFSLAVTILYSAAAMAAPPCRQSAAAVNALKSLLDMSFPSLCGSRHAQSKSGEPFRARFLARRHRLARLAHVDRLGSRVRRGSRFPLL